MTGESRRAGVSAEQVAAAEADVAAVVERVMCAEGWVTAGDAT